MWLLTTSRAELHFFTDASAVDGGYAILSHTWGEGEQSFQEVQAIGRTCRAAGTNPRDAVSPKIRGCCLRAESDGYDWVWIDSCCIDKTSSTEMSEAINSMFRWYQQAEVCYAYLQDVPKNAGRVTESNSAFRRSRWHTRGWTLQELIAPAIVIFLSEEWSSLGTKYELAGLLMNLTGIRASFLTREEHYSNASIATRMHWAARRSTTRIEDEAYSLMGLFDVHMPTIYGEGRQAFQRLQHEIMRTSVDTSLFAWGNWIPDNHLQHLVAVYNDDKAPVHHGSYLLAPFPKAFQNPFEYSPLRLDPARQPWVPVDGLGLQTQVCATATTLDVFHKR